MLWSFFWFALCYQHLVGVAKLQISEIHTGPFTAKAVSAFMGTDLLWPFPGVMFRYFPVDPWAWRGSNCRVHLSIGLHKGWAIEGAVRCPKGLGGKLYQKTGEHHNWRRESKKLTISARGWRLEWCLCGSAAFFDHCPVEDFWSKEFIYELWTHFWTSKFRQWFVAGNWGW